MQTGAIDSVIAGDTSGQCFSSYPLAEDGNYKFWVFADAYKATVTKEDGSEVEEDVYEQYNLGLVSTRSNAVESCGHCDVSHRPWLCSISVHQATHHRCCHSGLALA